VRELSKDRAVPIVQSRAKVTSFEE